MKDLMKTVSLIHPNPSKVKYPESKYVLVTEPGRYENQVGVYLGRGQDGRCLVIFFSPYHLIGSQGSYLTRSIERGKVL